MQQRQPHLQLSAMDCKNILPYVEQHLGTVMVSAQDPQPKESIKKLYDYLNASCLLYTSPSPRDRG